MRSRWLLLLLVLAVSACAGIGNRPGIKALAGQDLLVGSSNGVVSLNAGSGAVTFQGEGVPALGTWSSVFSTSVSGGTSLLEARDATSGEVLSSVEVPGELSVRIASADGSLVALMPPLPHGTSPWIPEPRARTQLTVADPTGATEPRSYDLKGNFEPEAFSWDGNLLYMISFIRPTAPEAYRVAMLSLHDGRVYDVTTGIKEIVETMAGTRLEQIADPDGSMLHTLYTTAPASYADHAHEVGTTVSFVHMLHLQDGWAHCLSLPKPMWGGDAADQAMALSADGQLLYVIDTAQGLIAEVRTRRPETLRTAEIDFGSVGSTASQASISPDGTLFVSSGSQVTAIDTATLKRSRTWTMDAPVEGLGSDAGHLYVATPGEVRVLDRSGQGELGTIAAPEVPDVAYIGLAEVGAA
jgi:hypothetical protein